MKKHTKSALRLILGSRPNLLHRSHVAFFGILFYLCCAPPALPESFKQVLAPPNFEEPRSHGAHPEYPTEWWYFTGHLQDSTKKLYGFELTFFRVGVHAQRSPNVAFGMQSILVAHAAVSIDDQKKFEYSEIIARDSQKEWAGYSSETLHVWIADWFAKMQGNSISLGVNDDKFGLQLRLFSNKPVVLHGKAGFSRKGPKVGDASHYSSFTRLLGEGSIRIASENERTVTVLGAWMDHEVLSSKVGADALGWDWFAIQLSNNYELMLYHLKTGDGSVSQFSSGSLVDPNGRVQPLQRDDFDITALDSWKSQASGREYPSSWMVQVPMYGIKLYVRPSFKAQELLTQKSTGVQYWEGRCLVDGSFEGAEINGNAYVELVGY